MRKIEKDMCEAIDARKLWGPGKTVVLPEEGYRSVWLHGNLIAEVYDNGIVRATLAGWNKPTTRSRINAVMAYFGGSGIHVVKGVPQYEGAPLGLYDWAVYYGKEEEKHNGL
jgi:hypothetical protein